MRRNVMILLLATLISCGLVGSDSDRPEIPGKLVFAAEDDEGTSQIYTMNADGSNLQQLTTHERFSVEPSWSPDGSQIAFATFRDAPQGATTLWVMDADGSNQRPLVNHPQTGNPMFGSNPAWSPDGTKLAFDYCVNCELGGKNREIFITDLQAGTIDTLIQHPASDSYPTWSPEGQRIAFVSDRDYSKEGGTDIYLIDTESGNITRVTKTGNAGRQLWSSIGEQLIYWSENHLHKLNLVNEQPQLISFDVDKETGFRPLAMLQEQDKILLQVFTYKNPQNKQSLQILDLSEQKLTPIHFNPAFHGADWCMPEVN